MNVTKITIGRLFNLGSYEHVRYDISVDVKDGESAQAAIIGLEKIISALAPESKCCVDTRAELGRKAHRLGELSKDLSALSEDEFRRRHGHFEGTPQEYVGRIAQSLASDTQKREAYERRAVKARQMLDSLGGAAVWKDAKLDWERDADWENE